MQGWSSDSLICPTEGHFSTILDRRVQESPFLSASCYAVLKYSLHDTQWASTKTDKPLQLAETVWNDKAKSWATFGIQRTATISLSNVLLILSFTVKEKHKIYSPI